VKEERANAFRRGVNTVLVIVLVFLVLFGFYLTWDLLGRPGWPSQVPSDRNVCLEVYFYDTSVLYLVPVHRQVLLARNETRTSRAIREFADGPRDPHLGRVYPVNIPPPSVTIRGDMAIVDLPEEIMSHLGGTSKEKALLDAITLTVDAAGECVSTRILMNGQSVETTPEGYILSEPLTPPEFFNHVPDSSLRGESKWVMVYYRDSTGRYLLPLSIEVDSGIESANEAVRRTLEYPPQLAYPPPSRICEPGYSLERLVIENSTAAVEVSVPDSQTAFLNSDINLFRLALFLTLEKCCGIHEIDLRINGRSITSYARFSGLPPVSESECWNLEYTIEKQGAVEVSTWGVEL